MNTKTRSEKMEMEKNLLRYMDALDRGDLDTAGKILYLAETDPEMETAILEINEELERESYERG